jgi:hypothetical protein
MRRVFAVTVKRVMEIFTDELATVVRRVPPTQESVCDECDCDCYECRAKQSATAKIPA